MEGNQSIKRLKLIKNHLSQVINKGKYISCALNYFNLDSYLSEKERVFRKDLREYLEKNITHNINIYLEREELPITEIRNLLKTFPNLLGTSKNEYTNPSFSTLMANIIFLELARSEPSICVFLFVQSEVVAQTIYMLGTEKQKQKYLSKLYSLDMIGCFCLTEAEVGSNASQIKTTAKKVEGGYIINGNKRWIGSATLSDLFIIWAKNLETNEINGFLVEKKDAGERINLKKINRKLAVRSVQNADIIFENVFVKDENVLKGSNFNEGPAKILLHSRISVAWGAIGISIGAYDRAVEYANKREQFGKPIASFQLIQEKLVKILGNTQAMIYLTKRALDLYYEGKMSIGRCGMVKAWTTSKCRENVALAREIFGGNGILAENWVIKALVDTEAFFTFEGSYDINVLACGREITGISAFK